MLGVRAPYLSGDLEPVLDVVDFPKGNPRLGHAVGTGVHAHEEDALGPLTIPFEILNMGLPGVFEGVVGVGDGFGKREASQFGSEMVGSGDKGAHLRDGDGGGEVIVWAVGSASLVGLAGEDNAGVVAGIGGFDAEKAAVVLVGEVAKLAGFFLPRIPDDGGQATVVSDGQAAVPLLVVEVDPVTASVVDAVDLGVDGEVPLTLCEMGLWGLGGVDVGGVLEPVDGDLGNVGDGEVAMKSASNEDGLGGEIFRRQACGEALSEGEGGPELEGEGHV